MNVGGVGARSSEAFLLRDAEPGIASGSVAIRDAEVAGVACAPDATVAR